MNPAARAAAGALAAACVLCAQAAPPAAAEPDTRTMIEALKPSATRGMRNLLVRQRPEAPVDAPVEAPVEGASAPASALTSALTSTATAASAPAGAEAAAEGPPGPAPSLSLAIQFDANSARVRPQSGAVLGSLVAALQSPELKASRFVIEGHTDARGAAAQNQRLSQERADEVRLYLVALGVSPARLRAVGKGATQLANSADPNAAENRRVRVVTVE